jgi:predicted ATPase
MPGRHHRNPQYAMVGECLQGISLVERGEFAAGAAQLKSALSTYPEQGWGLVYPTYLGVLAYGQARSARIDEAREAVDHAIAMAQKTGEQWYLPELLRIKSEVSLLDGSDEATAQILLGSAGKLAREQESLFWQLRIAVSQAGLLIKQGRQTAARQTLEPVYNEFTEGFGTSDIRAARLMLESTILSA